jgi:hypothetical protein
MRANMGVAAAGGKKGFDPSKVIISGKTIKPDEPGKAADESSGNHLNTKAASPALPEASINRLGRTSKQRDAYDELYDTLENLKPRGLHQTANDSSNRNVTPAYVVHAPSIPTVSTPASEQEQGDGYLALYERAQSKKRTKKEIFLTICGLWLIIFVLVKVFRWLAA